MIVLSDDCTIECLPLYIEDINDIREYDMFYLNITSSLNITNNKCEYNLFLK